ncbi:hypothetical protein [Rhizobium sp. SL42]|uniref:hypothetical protein n=1 Tax=Rhizobium sp. SL42 TaxID=2806346 RepID=UPI003FA7A07B|nr:hypothetical protein IM739_21905 [Rhizobium sp. SL42]
MPRHAAGPLAVLSEYALGDDISVKRNALDPEFFAHIEKGSVAPHVAHGASSAHEPAPIGDAAVDITAKLKAMFETEGNPLAVEPAGSSARCKIRSGEPAGDGTSSAPKTASNTGQ